MVVTRTCFSSLEYNGAEPTLLQSSDGIIFAEMGNISGQGKLSYREVGSSFFRKAKKWFKSNFIINSNIDSSLIYFALLV